MIFKNNSYAFAWWVTSFDENNIIMQIGFVFFCSSLCVSLLPLVAIRNVLFLPIENARKYFRRYSNAPSRLNPSICRASNERSREGREKMCTPKKENRSNENEKKECPKIFRRRFVGISFHIVDFASFSVCYLTIWHSFPLPKFLPDNTPPKPNESLQFLCTIC